jgi:ABC-type multidrug transport system fused ATPase/permease subunit
MQSYSLLRRLLPLIQARWLWVAAGYFATMTGVAVGMVQPVYFSQLIDQVLTAHDRARLVPILTLSAVFAVVSALAGIARGMIFRYLGVRHTLDIRNRVLAHLRKIPIPEIEKHGPGKYAALLGWDTSVAAHFFNHIVVEILIQCVTVLMAVGMIFYMNWQLGVAALFIVPILILIPRLYQRPMAHYTRRIREHNEEIGTFLYETIQGSRDIRMLGLEGWEARRNEKLYRNLTSISTAQAVYHMLTGQTSALAVSILIVLLYGYGSGQVLDGTLTVGMLVAAVQYFNNLLHPIMIMNNFFGEIKSSEVALERIEQFLRIEEDKSEAPFGKSPASGAEPSLLEARSVKVSYEGTEILKGVDFSVRAGQFAAFVGRSGSGKTTLLKTVIGIMAVESGELLRGGMAGGAGSGPRVGAVFQETFIFAGSLYENIAIGRLSATEEEIYEAACLAGLQSFVDSLPDGLRTRVDNQGFQLSGGQRQRIAIARMFLHKPDILILDEPTSALDRVTESQVLASLRKLMDGKTTLISTHRIETVRSADVIYVMDQGEVVDFGTHGELSSRCPLYRKLLIETDPNKEIERSTA